MHLQHPGIPKHTCSTIQARIPKVHSRSLEEQLRQCIHTHREETRPRRHYQSALSMSQCGANGIEVIVKLSALFPSIVRPRIKSKRLARPRIFQCRLMLF